MDTRFCRNSEFLGLEAGQWPKLNARSLELLPYCVENHMDQSADRKPFFHQVNMELSRKSGSMDCNLGGFHLKAIISRR